MAIVDRKKTHDIVSEETADGTSVSVVPEPVSGEKTTFEETNVDFFLNQAAPDFRRDTYQETERWPTPGQVPAEPGTDLEELADRVDVLEGDVDVLETDVIALQGDVTTIQGDVTTLQNNPAASIIVSATEPVAPDIGEGWLDTNTTTDMLSLYDLAVEFGFVGTEQEYLDTIPGEAVLNGTVAPTTEGRDGDFYINTTTEQIYGPKTAGAWGSPTNLIGTAGKTVLNGTVVPTTQGVDGDFYIKTNTNDIYGPKTAGAWGAATNLVGPQGDQGEQGIQGLTGLTGVHIGTTPPGDTGQLWLDTSI